MSENTIDEIRANYQDVLQKIDQAAQKVGRDPAEVKLVVVTKGQSVETIKAVIAAGATRIGESYVEDALPKIEELTDQPIEWHMIGHIQSRKARAVATHFDWVHSVDRLKIVRRLSNFATQTGRELTVLIECNISQEESKFGWPVWDEASWSVFANEISPLFDLPNIKVCGLMTMPPYHPDPEKSRPYFEKLVRLRAFLLDQYSFDLGSELSMGMSGDYAVAVECGATIVRVGTAIVGARS
jgi:pyridoxal phosphate enzyme (YggS family)